jgi:methylenetetrahydrofolate dehydrogenase (NADP+)/methenyltetrahydrofolate cyclohydrolase
VSEGIATQEVHMANTTGPNLMRGTALAAEIRASVAEQAARFEAASGRPPCLAAVLVGEDPASLTYVRLKHRRATEAGISSRIIEMPPSSTTAAVVSAVGRLSDDPEVDGILVQHPVAHPIDERAVFEAIDPAKDVDGVTMRSLASMALGLPGLVSATPGAILRLLDAYGVDLCGLDAVVVGRSPILGKPVALLLLARDATVTTCHSKTRNLPDIVHTADVVVAAVGKPEFVHGDWIQPGAVVIDAGYNPGNIGDVAFAEAQARASLITPVPGGVGPMTIAVLLEQTVRTAVARTVNRSQDRT